MITLVTTKGCSHCKQTENIFKQKGVDFIVKDITEFDSNIQDEYISKAQGIGISSFPLIVNDGVIVKMEDVVL
jgi:glutaredoxin